MPPPGTREIPRISGRLLAVSDARPLPRLRTAACLAVASLLLALVVSAPLCELGMEACFLPGSLPAEGASHCPMDAAGLGEMPCCIEEAVPHGPSPAAPGTPGQRVQIDPHAVAPVSLPAPLAPPTTTERGFLRPAPPAASPVPLYTLLSSLLS